MYSHSSSSQRIPPSPPTDTELINELKTGKHSALGILYDRYGKFVYRLALQILKNSQEAEDLTQEIFLALWRSNSYNPARGSLSSFLTTMTRSRAIDKLRSRGRNLKFLDSWRQNLPTTAIASNNPFEHVALGERSQQLHSALGQLSPDQRQVLEMAYYEGLSLSEIAQKLDIPLGTVKTRSRLGLLKLRQILEDFIK